MRFFRPFHFASMAFASAAALATVLALGALAAPAHAQVDGAPLDRQEPPVDSTITAPALLNPPPTGADTLLAQQPEEGGQAVPLSLAEAVRIALARNYALRRTRLTVENAQAQIREAWGSVLPQVSVNGSYTRNVVQANPFAGGDLGGLFGGGNAGDWVAFNERARQDADPATQPITFEEFQQRQAQGRREAGIAPGGGAGGNPFGVDNQFASGLSITQPLFNGQAFVAIQGAQQLEEVNILTASREEQTLIDQTRLAYYQALLNAEQARVTAQSVERTQQTYQEVAQQVAAGVAPKFERVSLRVELANLRTQFVQRRNQAELAVDELKRTIGFPVSQPVRLRGALQVEDLGEFTQVSTEAAVATALESRPDVRRAQLAVELRQIDKRTVQAQYLPTLSAFADFNYTGRVPDNRTSTVMPDPTDPFTFAQTSQGFFADDLWNPSVGVGLQLSWNVFSGFQRAARVQQRQVAVSQARLDFQQLVAQVRLEVRRALRTLATARQRLQSQQANVQRAELSYAMAQERLGVGVATQLQVREASDQLDQARLSYLQAVYDYLTAKSAFETALGEPVDEDSLFQFTSR